MIVGAGGCEARAGVGLAEGGATGRVTAGAGVVWTDTAVECGSPAGSEGVAGVGDDDAVGELGDGLKLSKVEFPVPVGSASFVAAGSGALGTVVVDFRPRL